MPPPFQRPTGMVGKKELLVWVSEMCGRPVVSFSELKDGVALVVCVKETWPLAYDKYRENYPKRPNGKRDTGSNYSLIADIFKYLGVPASVLDTRGIKAAAFKPCWNLLVCAFFLRNLALYSDFSVDFTHPVDSTLARFLQSPDSVASLRKGGALSNSKASEQTVRHDGKKAKRRSTTHENENNLNESSRASLEHTDANPSVSARAERAAQGHAHRMSRPTPNAGEKGKWEANPPREENIVMQTPGSVFRPPSRAKGKPSMGKQSENTKEATSVPHSAPTTPARSLSPKRSNSLGRFLKRRASVAVGTSGEFSKEFEAKEGLSTRQVTEPTGHPAGDLNESIHPEFIRDGMGKQSEPSDDPKLNAALFEVEGFRRVLRLMKSEQNDLGRKHVAELDACRSQALAETQAVRDTEKRKRQQLELRLENQRADDQRAFLRELRQVAEETSVAVGSGVGLDEDLLIGDDTNVDGSSAVQIARSRAALEAVRGREVVALGNRITTLEREREKLLVGLSVARVSDGNKNDDTQSETVEQLRSELRLAEARHVADASSRAREIDELRLDLRTVRNENADAINARVSLRAETGGALRPETSSFDLLLMEHRDNRKVARVEQEKKQAIDTCEALRKQVEALVEDEQGDNGKMLVRTSPDDSDDHSASDAGALLRAIDVLRTCASDALGELSSDCDENELLSINKKRETVDAAAAAAEAAAWRRAAAAAVRRRQLLRATKALTTCESKIASLELQMEDDKAMYADIESNVKQRARSAEDDLSRERAAGGVRAALAEEAERLARDETQVARNEAQEARAAASAAHGISAGALRDARDTCAKLKLRETHWVGLVECHREAADLSRLISEMNAVMNAGDDSSDSVFHQKAELERVTTRRAELESEAQRHVEAIEAIASMLPDEIRLNTEFKNATDETNLDAMTRVVARAAAAEKLSETLRIRLAKKTEDAASLALRAKRHELRAEEAASVRAKALRDLSEAREKQNDITAQTNENLLKAKAELKTKTKLLQEAQAALEDRDAALEVGVAVIRADPESAKVLMSSMKSQSRNKENTPPKTVSPSRSFGGFMPILFGTASPEKSENIDDKNLKASTPKVTKTPSKHGVGTLLTPEAVAVAVAEATRAIATTPGSVGSGVGGQQVSTRKNVFASLDAVVSPPPSSGRRKNKQTKNDDTKLTPARLGPDALSPGGESTGSVGTPLMDVWERGAPKSPVVATPSPSSRGQPTSPLYGDVIDAAVDDLTESAGLETPTAMTRNAKNVDTGPASSPFAGLLNLFTSPRRVPLPLSPLVEEETEDSQGTDDFDLTNEEVTPGVVQTAGGATPLTERTNYTRNTQYSPTAGGLSSYSPGDNVNQSVNADDVNQSSITLPGGLSFLRDAEAHLEIDVKKSWFGLKDDERSPISKRSD